MTRIRGGTMITGLALVGFLFTSQLGGAWGLEKVKFSTAVRGHPFYILPPIAAQEKGFWREEGLEAEWVAFVSGAIQARALASGDVPVAFTSTVSAVMYAS